jgi:hypothetical protein
LVFDHIPVGLGLLISAGPLSGNADTWDRLFKGLRDRSQIVQRPKVFAPIGDHVNDGPHVRTVTYGTSELASIDQYRGHRTKEGLMHPTIHSTQVVTPFGSGYVHEDHGSDPRRKGANTRSRTILAVVLTVGLFGGATGAAITATHRGCTSGSLQQNLPSILGKLPGSVGFEEALY